MTTKTLEFNNIEQKMFWILIALLGVSVAFFMYSAFSITIAGVSRDNMNRTAHELSVTSGALEQTYLEQSNTITLAYAQSLGFEEVRAKFSNSDKAKFSLAQ
ncbi:MAG: hypothetical protein Q7K40_03500 [bacterium]|nr:hypothetical protein [bacterium]